MCVFFFKQKTAYEMRISDWSSDVCSSDLATTQGNLWNAENFARSLGITRPTVNRYLGFMEGAFMVRVLQPWFRNIKKRLVKSPKVYIRDSGLLHSLLGLDDYETLINQIGRAHV